MSLLHYLPLERLRYCLPERLRWRIIELVGKLPGQCWFDLCDWAGTWKDEDPDGFMGYPWFLPWRPDQGHCRDDMTRCGSCYCGKLRDDVRIAQIVSDESDGAP